MYRHKYVKHSIQFLTLETGCSSYHYFHNYDRSTMRQAIHKDIKDEWAIVFRTSSEESAPQWPRNCSAAAPRGGAVVVEEE